MCCQFLRIWKYDQYFFLAFSDEMLHFHALLVPPNYIGTCVWNMIIHQLTIISDKREFPRTVSDFEENHWQPFGKSFLLPSSIFHLFHSFFCDATKLIVTFSDFLVDVALHFGKGRTSNLGVSPVFRQPVNLRFFYICIIWGLEYCLYICLFL